MDPVTPYADFGAAFLRAILPKERILRSIDRLVGDRIELGPIAAGPGRVFAKARATGIFQPTFGEEVPGPLLSYRVFLPVEVDFELDIAVDVHRFHATLIVPLMLTLRTERPALLVWDLTLPLAEEVELSVGTAKRRSQVLQRVAGLDQELRRFLLRVIEKELAKEHIQRALTLDLPTLVDGAWEALADQFLPPLPGRDEHSPYADPGQAPLPGLTGSLVAEQDTQAMTSPDAESGQALR